MSPLTASPSREPKPQQQVFPCLHADEAIAGVVKDEAFFVDPGRSR